MVEAVAVEAVAVEAKVWSSSNVVEEAKVWSSSNVSLRLQESVLLDAEESS